MAAIDLVYKKNWKTARVSKYPRMKMGHKYWIAFSDWNFVISTSKTDNKWMNHEESSSK